MAFRARTASFQWSEPLRKRFHVSPRDLFWRFVRSAGLYVPTTAGCHSRASLPADAESRTQNRQ